MVGLWTNFWCQYNSYLQCNSRLRSGQVRYQFGRITPGVTIKWNQWSHQRWEIAGQNNNIKHDIFSTWSGTMRVQINWTYNMYKRVKPRPCLLGWLYLHCDILTFFWHSSINMMTKYREKRSILYTHYMVLNSSPFIYDWLRTVRQCCLLVGIHHP